MQTGHLQNVCGHHDLFNFPIPAFFQLLCYSHCLWVW
jgi:hypothetical protein